MSATASPPNAFLPMSRAEMTARGWDAVDVVFVSGDAYVDHPSFAAALLCRLLEADGYRVAILSQPDWRSCRPWQTFGRPRLCFAVSAGNMDSMLNHYTANRKVRNDDAYSPGGQIGRRPDRATLAYCQRAREAYRGVPVIAGGVEASLRRLAHYDYWSDKVRRSILLDSKADLLVYGMGERPLLEIVARLAGGEPIARIRDIRGTAYRLGANEAGPLAAALVPGDRGTSAAAKQQLWHGLLTVPPSPTEGLPVCHFEETFGQTRGTVGRPCHNSGIGGEGEPDAPVLLPSYEQVAADPRAFVTMTRLLHDQTNPYHARPLVQPHGREAVVVNPPAWPLEEAEMDRLYGLPFLRRPHPGYVGQPIPAYEVVKGSIQIVRGCFGGCTFCSLSAHQGRIIQSRSRQSVLAEVRRVAAQPGSSGIISDLGGPTANMYGMNCGRPEVRRRCRRASCLFPSICALLETDHGPLVQLMRDAREQPGVKQVLVASGVRMDLALRSPAYIDELSRHHTGGLLKVAPEHTDPETLRRMGKPTVETFAAFEQAFRRAAATAGKEQHLVPYFLAGHPGCDLAAMIDLALYLKRSGYRPDKVQDFIPLPMDIATCMYHTGIDPLSGREVFVPKGTRQRRWQRALLQYFKPENYAEVREALLEAGREDLIGPGTECLIPSRPPVLVGQQSAGAADRPRSAGYRPRRKGAKRR